jgi:hypothetical protein
LNDLVRRIHVRWLDSSAPLEPGTAPSDLAAFEARHGVRVPPAFAALWGAANGNHGDENLTRFWPLAEIRRLTEEDQLRGKGRLPAEARDYFAFADYMIFSHVYAIRLTADGQDGPVWWVFSATEHVEIGPTFEAFLRAYAAEPESILFPSELGKPRDAAL